MFKNIYKLSSGKMYICFKRNNITPSNIADTINLILKFNILRKCVITVGQNQLKC